MSKVKAYIWKIRKIVERIVRFVSEDMWKVNTDSFSTARQRLIKYLKVVMLALQTFAERGIGFQSVALSYFSMMAIIPFLAICFIVTNGFGSATAVGQLKSLALSPVATADHAGLVLL